MINGIFSDIKDALYKRPETTLLRPDCSSAWDFLAKRLLSAMWLLASKARGALA
jgi:hypothetical protein